MRRTPRERERESEEHSKAKTHSVVGTLVFFFSSVVAALLDTPRALSAERFVP